MEKLADISIFNSLTKTTRIHNDLSPRKQPQWPRYAKAKKKARNTLGKTWTIHAPSRYYGAPFPSHEHEENRVSVVPETVTNLVPVAPATTASQLAVVLKTRTNLVSAMSSSARSIMGLINDFSTCVDPDSAKAACDILQGFCKKLGGLAQQGSVLTKYFSWFTAPTQGVSRDNGLDSPHSQVQQKNRSSNGLQHNPYGSSRSNFLFDDGRDAVDAEFSIGKFDR